METHHEQNAGGSRPTLVLVGGGGHCRSVIDVIEADGTWRIAGYVDLPDRREEQVLGYSWLGADEDLRMLAANHGTFLITVGQIGLPGVREGLFRRIELAGGRFASICSPTAWVSHHARVGRGTVVMHQAVINAGSIIGAQAIVNTAAVVEHDVRIGLFCHVSTGARVNGGCVVGDRCFIGSGAVIREGVRLGEGTVVGCGAVVVEDTTPFGVYVGVPARRIRDSRETVKLKGEKLE